MGDHAVDEAEIMEALETGEPVPARATGKHPRKCSPQDTKG
jgi:hypothetical protein